MTLPVLLLLPDWLACGKLGEVGRNLWVAWDLDPARLLFYPLVTLSLFVVAAWRLNAWRRKDGKA